MPEAEEEKTESPQMKNEQLEQLVERGAIAKSEDQIRERSDDYWSYYANNMVVGFSSWDAFIVFGEITGVRDGKAVIEEVVRITLTREMLKVMSQVLAINVAGWEQQHGEIKLPEMTGVVTVVAHKQPEAEPA